MDVPAVFCKVFTGHLICGSTSISLPQFLKERHLAGLRLRPDSNGCLLSLKWISIMANRRINLYATKPWERKALWEIESSNAVPYTWDTRSSKPVLVDCAPVR